MKHGALAWCISLSVILCLTLIGGWASASSAQGLAALGPIDPANGYPLWYRDSTGFRLRLCITQTGFCITEEPNPALPISFPDNFSVENFYFLGETTIDLPGGGLALYIAALESSFINEDVINGDQIVFARIRIRIDLTEAGTYTVTHPYGVETFDVTTPGRRAINFTSDVGIAPGIFTGALAGGVGPFLHSATGNVTDGAGNEFLANPNLPTNVTGSPFGTNIFQIDGPNIGGPGVNTVRTDLFNLMGQIFIPPHTTTSLTSIPNPSTFGQGVGLVATVSPVPPGFGVPDGTITFRDGATSLGVVALVNGSAALVTSALTAGAHSLTAVYSGSEDFQGSTSLVVTQTVNKGSTSTSLSSTPNPSTFGQTVTLTSSVSAVPPASGVPTGTVTFMDGATQLAVVTLVNGSASLTTSTLTVGSHSLTAIYSGSANFLASTSPTVTQTVNPGSTTTSLTSTPNPSTFGQTVTLNATVSPVAPATGVPTGTVTFRDGATSLGVVPLVNGSASLSISTLAAGSHSLTAVYSGSATFAASTSAVVTHTVNPGNTTTSLTSTPNPSNFGQTVTLSATVSPVAPATGVPTGTVTFRDGATALATVTLVNGSASLSISTLTPGSHSLTAVYNGSASFAGSTSAVLTHVVNAGNSSTSLTSTPNPSTTGQTVTLTATVSAVAPATGTPTGTVTFRDGATVLSTVALVNGSASFQTAALTVGSHPLTATYNGSATFATSTSAVVTQVVNAPAAAATSTSLTSTPNPSTVGQTVTLSATVTSAAGVPAGTVTFRDGVTVLSTVTLVNGSASFQTAALTAGSHPLTATFNGSAAFAASTSPTVIQVVNAANNAADTVTINRAELRRNQGELRVEGINSTIPGNGFAASVEIRNGAAVGNTCPGALIATTAVSAADGSWRFRGNTALAVTTVCVKSAGGGVASRAVQQR